MKNMDWNDLRYFLGVARSGSLTGAAVALQVSQSTVSRRITALENDLGTRLFTRHATGYFLTDQGRDVFRQAESVEENIAVLEHGFGDLDASAAGRVRLATADSLAIHLIIPALPQLNARYPNLRLEIITGINTVDLPRYEADLALRLVRPEQGNLVLQRLGNMTSAVYGAKNYLQQHPAVASDPCAGRAFIIWDKSYGHLPAARWLSDKGYDHRPVLVTTSVAAQYAAVKAGMGLALLPCFLAEKDDDLAAVIPSQQVFSEAMWLVTQADLRLSARIRVVIAFLNELLKSHPLGFSDLP
ncbi:LysR family transcriptional regulator [Brenneria sp. 4F2]|nr:LysR family transcriptional regulator [Brenneria bubanii]